MLALISAPPFSKLPLHIRCFTEYAHEILLAAAPLPRDVTVILDLGGVSGSTGRRRESTLGATSQSGPIDVSDSAFRSNHWEKWIVIREAELNCGICNAALDSSVCHMIHVLFPDNRITSTTLYVQRTSATMLPMCCASRRS